MVASAPPPTNAYARRAAAMVRAIRKGACETKGRDGGTKARVLRSVASRLAAAGAPRDTLLHLLVKGRLPDELRRVCALAPRDVPLQAVDRSGATALHAACVRLGAGGMACLLLRLEELQAVPHVRMMDALRHETFLAPSPPTPTTCADTLLLREELCALERLAGAASPSDVDASAAHCVV